MTIAFAIFFISSAAAIIMLVGLGNHSTAEQEMSASLIIAGLIFVSFFSGLAWIALTVVKLASL